MWYAPIGSLEYTINLHNDIIIKKYILSEQRNKQQSRLFWQSQLTQNNSQKEKINKKGFLNLRKSPKQDIKRIKDNSDLKSKTDVRINRIKGCAVDVLIKRSFKKTSLDVVTYDSTFK